MIILDTSCLVRFFTKDNLKKAKKVKKLLKEEENIYIPKAVFPELEYVLQGSYRASRDKICKAFKFLISRSNIKADKIIKKAVEIFEKTSLDIADCLIVSESLGNRLASWDKKMLGLDGVKEYWK